jgi:hypothetical protein
MDTVSGSGMMKRRRIRSQLLGFSPIMRLRGPAF